MGEKDAENKECVIPAALMKDGNNNSSSSSRLTVKHTNVWPLQKVKEAVFFFREATAVAPEAISEYLTTPSCFPLQVCACYMASLPLVGKTLPEALRELLTVLPLPREGQRIERLLEYFSAAYFAANMNTKSVFAPSTYGFLSDSGTHCSGKSCKMCVATEVDRQVFPFCEDSLCFVAVVATVMLNTDQHNPHAGAKMNRKSFISQMSAAVKSSHFTTSFA
uniref:SEC7 domain-containing protein n=1 Tax=Lygus hesperus TaxID=30085 RepID=A0A146L5N7_LYGHE